MHFHGPTGALRLAFFGARIQQATEALGISLSSVTHISGFRFFWGRPPNVPLALMVCYSGFFSATLFLEACVLRRLVEPPLFTVSRHSGWYFRIDTLGLLHSQPLNQFYDELFHGHMFAHFLDS